MPRRVRLGAEHGSPDGADGSSPWREFRQNAGPVEPVPTHLLQPAESPRVSGEDAAHVRALAASDLHLPPIVVHRPTLRVIDGMHRLRAARLRGRREVEVRFFDGSADDAFVLAVEANTANGLPLSLADRRAAAARILRTHPDRSDRWIALVSGLAATTVGAIRRCSTAEIPRSNSRIGRDGRVRPLDGSAGRRLAGELMRADPSRSLRDIARAAGIAPSTALDVRNRLTAGLDPVRGERTGVRRPDRLDDQRQTREVGQPAARDAPVDPAAVINQLRRDPSLRFNETGRALLRWLDVHTVEDHTMPSPAAIPGHCVPTVVALARYNARFWASFGDQLDVVERAQQAVHPREPPVQRLVPEPDTGSRPAEARPG